MGEHGGGKEIGEMAGGGKRGGGERVLESRHLVGLFLGVVLLCAVFFTLGYVMGRTQFSGSVHAADSPFRSAPFARELSPPKAKEGAGNSAAAPPPGNEWDFFSKRDNNHLEPAPAATGGKVVDSSPGTAAKAVPVAEKPPAKYQSPVIPKGSVVLQLAALKSENDALALADAVQQKKFPSFVLSPSSDNFYRVQVGPYADEKSAEAAREGLAKAGFNAIIKR
jgi:DedD protein